MSSADKSLSDKFNSASFFFSGISFSSSVFRYSGLGNFAVDSVDGGGVGFDTENIRVKHEAKVKLN